MAILLTGYGYFFPRWADPNQNSRLDMVFAVVEDGTFRIDPYVANTVDYARVGDHYYSDKSPGAAFLGIPIYAGLKLVLDLPVLDTLVDRLSNNTAFQSTLNPEGTGILEQKVRFALAQVTLTFFISAIPSGMLGLLIYQLLSRFTNQLNLRFTVVLIYGLLTPAFVYANAFYGHQLSAFLLFSAFYLAFMLHEAPSRWKALWIGFLLGYSVITEYPTAIIVIMIFAYTALRFYRLNSLPRIIWVMLSAGVVAIAWMAYNNQIFGGPLSLGYQYSELWQAQHQTGFMSLTSPGIDAIWGILFSPYRGLFFYSPILLLAIPGFVFWWRARKFRLESILVFSIVLYTFLFNASSSMWWGGFAVGPRYLLPMLPFIGIPLLFTIEKYRNRTWFVATTVILKVWTLIALWGVAFAGQAYPSDTLSNPFIEYALPNWAAGNIARNLGTIIGLSGAMSLATFVTILFILILLSVGSLNKLRAQNYPQ
jgi:hypothetical protein